jgi:hypothetical protein
VPLLLLKLPLPKLLLHLLKANQFIVEGVNFYAAFNLEKIIVGVYLILY